MISPPDLRVVLAAIAAAAGLLVVAVANTAGYRFGVSDQEFYIPAIYLELDRTLFPHDRPMIEAQGTFLAFDELAAAATRATGIGLPALFLGGYVGALLALFGGAWLVGRRWYASPWTAAALAVALTLRHQVPGTGVNTFEGYLHPRTLAFGLGVLALAVFVRGRLSATLLLVAIASLVHPTTAAWFAMWLAVATLASRRPSRGVVAVLTVCGALGAALLVWLAFDRGAAPMSTAWAEGATRRYLFFSAWPAGTWIAHAAIVGVAVYAYGRRAAAGLVDRAERGVFAGALALLAFMLAAVPFVEARVPLAVQLQPGRILWVWDFLATAYLLWLLAEHARVPSAARARAVFAVVALVACARGAYIMAWEFPDRPLIRMHLPGGEWGRVMAWASSTPAGSNFLTDPGHAWRYGVSVRIGARRDVFLEAGKDPALATYSAEAATRVVRRQRDLGDFNHLDARRARALDRRYDLDYVIAEHRIDLPVVREFGAFKVYSLRDR